MFNHKYYVKTGAFGYYGGYFLRKLCSLEPILGFVPKANTFGRKDGISALVKTRNEPWIVPSLVSIKDFADEIIVVDSSTDNTPEKVREAVGEYGVNVSYIHKICDIQEAYKIALSKSTCKWLIKWDGDFVAFTPQFKKLKELLTNLSEQKYYIIEFPHVCVDLDFLHVDKRQPYHTEGWIFTYSPILYDYVENRNFPRFYEKKLLTDIYALHLRRIKLASRILDNSFQGGWIREQDKDKYSNCYEEYVKTCIGIEDISEVAEKRLENLKEFLMPYEGSYPKILEDYIQKEFNINIESWNPSMLEVLK